MAELTIFRDGEQQTVFFQAPAALDDVLREAGFLVPHPCGGRGSCGKCAVSVRGEVSPVTQAEQRANTRLSCQTVLLGNAAVTLPDSENHMKIQLSGEGSFVPVCPMEGKTGAAVDVGTTTLAVRTFDLTTGRILGESACMNPQTAVAADVMGRIGAAMNGQLSLLSQQARKAIGEMLGKAGEDHPDVLVITGNTTMLYLLTGRDPEPLSHAPFLADTLFGCETELFGGRVYLPPCMNAFVGADITCAVLASGMCQREEVSLLCDIGTNGELALWDGETLYVTSTAAGPAFEGAGISCGCGSIPGAIDRVWEEDGKLCVHTIDGAPAAGVCGSGLIDAVAAGLAVGELDETGLLSGDELFLSGEIALQQKDIRAVQLAKAAVGAGIRVLLEVAGIPICKVDSLYIAGGFGSHLDVKNACAIGMLPEELADRTVVLGNAALSGAAATLLNRDHKKELERIAAASKHVDLGGNPSFNEKYVDGMFFPE